jgi:NADPH:quinone reductase-like Zn-dependent oxidoreductase
MSLRICSAIHSGGEENTVAPIPETMAAVVLTGHGGFDKLEYRTDVPVPRPKQGQVLIHVSAAGVNNTDINTRIGWYSKSVTGATDQGGTKGFDALDDRDASWSGAALSFPRIQGADCCGRIVAVAADVDSARIGERVIVRSMQRDYVDDRPYALQTLGSEYDGAFAQFVTVPAREAYRVDCDWKDAELASIPCAYSTAENMLHRAGLSAGERVLITGASGGVGSAAVQLAKRRKAEVLAVAGAAKTAAVAALGADRVIPREAELEETVAADSLDLVVDLVAGARWPVLLDLLRCGGRYAVAGAIAGPVVELDVRTLYLKDLTLYGCTFQEDSVFENLVGYIETDQIRPVVAGTYPLERIVDAQRAFLEKKYVGKLVLVPPD